MHDDTPPVPRPAIEGRKLVVVAIAAAIAGTLIVLSFGYADRSPKPHDVELAVAGPPGSARQVDAGLRRAAPGGFAVRPVASAAAARRAVRDQDADGALVIPASGPNVVITAGGAGPSLQRAITAALGAASAAMHRATRAVDVAPLPADDRAGLGAFIFQLGLLIPSVLGSVGLFLVGLRARLWWRIAAAALFAVLVAAGSALVLGPALGMIHGAAMPVFAIGALGALTFVLVIAVSQAAVGLAGTGVAAFTFIFVGNAIAGGTVPRQLLPDGYRQLSEWMPNGAIVRGVRDVVSFDDRGLGHPLLVFGIWTAAALALLVAIDLLHLAERRAVPGRPHAEIYATPAFAHVAVRRRRRADRLSRSAPARPRPTDTGSRPD